MQIASSAPLRLPRFLAPLLAVFFFILNTLDVLRTWLYTPPGYVPSLQARDIDTAQHLTWVRGAYQGVLLPDFHAPWITEAVMFSPFMWLIAQFRYLGLDAPGAMLLVNFLCLLAGAYGIVLCLENFTASRGQAIAAALLTFCAVPVHCLASLPLKLFTHSDKVMFGFSDFLRISREGFIIPATITMTFGTASVFLALGVFGSYIRTGQRRYLLFASLVTAVNALLHPFEVFAILSGAGLSLLVLRGTHWRRACSEIAVLAVPSMLAILPYVYFSQKAVWMSDLTRMNRGGLVNPFRLLESLGLPAIAALLGLLVLPKGNSPTDRTLQCWFAGTLLVVHLPFVPYPVHALDGFMLVTALLLVSQFSTSLWLQRQAHRFRTPLYLAGVLLLLLSVTPHVLFRSFLLQISNGISATQAPNTAALKEEADTVAWLRQHARPEELVLSPPEHASWLATAPVHSFASHWLFSVTCDRQGQEALRFYQGQLSPEQALRFFAEYGINYVVVPATSSATAEARAWPLAAQIGTWSIYRFPANRMKPYPGLAQLTN